jgi:hypothetical protein
MPKDAIPAMKDLLALQKKMREAQNSVRRYFPLSLSLSPSLSHTHNDMLHAANPPKILTSIPLLSRRVAMELLETERNYVASLKAVKDEVIDKIIDDSDLVLHFLHREHIPLLVF